MRYVLIPPSVVLLRGASPFSYSFADCVTHVVDTDDSFIRPASKIRAALRIIEALETDQGFITLQDGDYELLAKAFEAPSSDYAMLVRGTEPVKFPHRLLLPFIEAVANASSLMPSGELPQGGAASAEPAS